MQKSFWWWQCSDRYIISLFPRVHNPFPPPPVSNKPHSFCGHQASCLQNAVRYRQTAQGLYKPSETQTKHWGTQTKHCETQADRQKAAEQKGPKMRRLTWQRSTRWPSPSAAWWLGRSSTAGGCRWGSWTCSWRADPRTCCWSDPAVSATTEKRKTVSVSQPSLTEKKTVSANHHWQSRNSVSQPPLTEKETVSVNHH